MFSLNAFGPAGVCIVPEDAASIFDTHSCLPYTTNYYPFRPQQAIWSFPGKAQKLPLIHKIGTLSNKNSEACDIAGIQGGRNMNWLQNWLDRRRVKALKAKIERMKIEAKNAEVVPLMPAVETITHRIRRERLVVLERAIEKIEPKHDTGDAFPSSDTNGQKPSRR